MRVGGDNSLTQGFVAVKGSVQIWLGALDDLAHQAVAVGVHTVGFQAQNHIARLDIAAGDNLALFNHANGKAGQVVFAYRVHARHFGGFTTDQCAACLLAAFGDALDDVGSLRYIQLAAGKVVKEEQRFGALYQNVVDTHGHQVDADGIMFVPVKGELQLGTDAVSTGNQYRLLVFFGNFHQCAETAEATEDFRTHGAFGKRLDVFDERVACIDIDAGITVTEGRGVQGKLAFC